MLLPLGFSNTPSPTVIVNNPGRLPFRSLGLFMAVWPLHGGAGGSAAICFGTAAVQAASKDKSAFAQSFGSEEAASIHCTSEGRAGGRGQASQEEGSVPSEGRRSEGKSCQDLTVSPGQNPFHVRTGFKWGFGWSAKDSLGHS